MSNINVCAYRNPCSLIGEDCSDGTDLCKSGEPISDSMIVTEEAARERGRGEIDRVYTDRMLISGNLYLIPWIQPGSIVSIQDTEYGTYKAMLRGFSISFSRGGHKKITATASVQLERKLDEYDR